MRGKAREALLEGAVSCLRERGYAATTQRDVLAASGANARSITYHFGSLDRLLAEALGEVFRRRSAPLLAALAEDAAGSFGKVYAELLAAVKSDRELAFALTDAISQARDDEVRRALAEHYAELRTSLTELADAAAGDELRAAGADPATLASALLAMFDGLVLQWLLDPDAAPADEDVVPAIGAAFGTVRVSPARPSRA